jgi:ketosteroid isomerase-like protein
LPFLDPDFEFHEPPEQPAARVFHGHAEALSGWARWSEAWIEQRSDVVEVIELADGRVLALTIQYFRGRDGIELTQPNASIFSFQGGKIARWQAYWERDTALQAAGLSE